MRLNSFIAQATGLSRRAADATIIQGRARVNAQPAKLGMTIQPADVVTLDNQLLKPRESTLTIMLNKPTGFVCSRDGQGSKTIYDLLPSNLHYLKPVGRLDKNSSGLLLLTNDGQLSQHLTHPKFQKEKIYHVLLTKPLTELDRDRLEKGILLEDGLSALRLQGDDQQWVVTLSEGRNRQIRRTFASLGYRIARLHRTNFGEYSLHSLASGRYKEIVRK